MTPSPKKSRNPRQRAARRRLLEEAALAAQKNTTVTAVVTTTVPTSSAPQAPPATSIGSQTRYAKWVQDSSGGWVGQGTQTQPYRNISVRTSTDVGLRGPDGVRYADVSAYRRWQQDAIEADLPNLDPAKPVDMIRRIAASLVETTQIITGKLHTVRWNKKFYLPGVQHTVDLSAVLNELAAGDARFHEHSNANSRFGNNGRNLTEYFGERFLEYGWLFPVQNLIKRRNFDRFVREQVRVRNRFEWREVNRPVTRDIIDFETAPGVAASQKDKLDLTSGIVDQNRRVDAGLRLIISNRGDVYFSPDHYVTFYRYSATYTSDDGAGGTWEKVKYFAAASVPDTSWYWPSTSVGTDRVWSLRNW